MRRFKDWEKALRKEALEEARKEAREDAEGIRSMLKAELAETENVQHERCPCDHCSPSPIPPAAPAPDHTYNTPARFHQKDRTPTDRVSFRELLARANRAARQAMRGKQWGEADRQDAASHAVESVIRKATSLEGSQPDLPAELAAGVALYRLAKDCREAKRASADRDNADYIRQAFSQAVHPDPGQQLQVQRDVCRTIHAALIAAWDMLADLGLPTTGPTFTVAYTAARMTVLDSYADVAAELGMSRAAHKKVISRASLSIPAAGTEYRPNVRVKSTGSLAPAPAAFLAALHSLDKAEAGSSRSMAAGLETDWRQAPPAQARVTVERTRRYCKRTPADWTKDLTPRARQALHAASSSRQERAGIPTHERCKA